MPNNASTPLYSQVKDALAKRISSGEFPVGSNLPSEAELCEMFAVSSITIRRATAELQRDGLIKKHRGAGSIVTSRTKRLTFTLVFLGYEDLEWSRHGKNIGNMLSGVTEAAWTEVADFSTVRLPMGPNVGRELVDIAQEQDGMLLLCSYDIRPHDITPLEASELPLVLLRRHLVGHQVSSIAIDDFAASYRATTHLLGLGHERIALILGSQDVEPRRRQVMGYRRAMSDAGRPVGEDLIQPIASSPVPDEAAGRSSMRNLLARDEPPDAVVVYHHQLTTGTMAALRESGVRIPDDVAVVACGDDIEPEAFTPRLTAVTTSVHDLGKRSVEILFDVIRNGTNDVHEIMDPPLVVRDSCGGQARRSGDQEAVGDPGLPALRVVPGPP